MYKDEVYETNKEYASEEEAYKDFESASFIKEAKEKFGRELPYLWVFKVNGKIAYGSPNPKKQGIPMDWRFYAEIDKITEADIEAEKNIEKRRLLIMEYGVNKYLKNVQHIHKDSYGELISATLEDDVQQFVKVRNGTPEPVENRAYLKEKGMLTDDGHKIYYIPVSNDVHTAKEGIEESWALKKGTLSDHGWDEES